MRMEPQCAIRTALSVSCYAFLILYAQCKVNKQNCIIIILYAQKLLCP